MLGSLERLVPRFRTDINMIGRHLIIATGHQGRGRFAHDQFLSGEIPEKRLEISLMVVEAQHIQGIRAEQMIRRVYLVTAGGNDPGGIQPFHDSRQMTGDQGLTAKGRILQQSGIDGMARIQDQVRRLQIQLGSVGMTPLLKYLIAYTPHENRGVIPVTQRSRPSNPARATPRNTGRNRMETYGVPTYRKTPSCTRRPIRSQRSSNSGAGALWLVRIALTPISFMICSWRSIARVFTAAPRQPKS